MKLSVRRYLGGLLSLGLVLAAGCADSGVPTAATIPAAVEVAPPSFSGSGSPDVGRLARYDSPPSITIAWAKKWIGPAGGRLDFYGFAIEVPAGAVDKVTQFSIRLPVDPTASVRVVAEFGPHRTFAVPVSIELPYRGTSAYEAGGTVGWWDPDMASWVDVGGVVTADGERLRTRTDHFSTYGTMEEGRSDTVILSGG